jgi:hypothetical protein
MCPRAGQIFQRHDEEKVDKTENDAPDQRSNSPMPLFRVIAGTAEFKGKVYNWRDPQNNVIESDTNLAALQPGKFERIDDTFDWAAHGERVRRQRTEEEMLSKGVLPPLDGPGQDDQNKVVSSPSAVAPGAKRQSIDEKYGPLDDKNDTELREIAEAEGVKVKANAKKEDVVKALRGGAGK